MSVCTDVKVLWFGTGKFMCEFSGLKLPLCVSPEQIWPSWLGPRMKLRNFPWKSLWPMKQNRLTSEEYRIWLIFSTLCHWTKSSNTLKHILFNGNVLFCINVNICRKRREWIGSSSARNSQTEGSNADISCIRDMWLLSSNSTSTFGITSSTGESLDRGFLQGCAPASKLILSLLTVAFNPRLWFLIIVSTVTGKRLDTYRSNPFFSSRINFRYLMQPSWCFIKWLKISCSSSFPVLHTWQIKLGWPVSQSERDRICITKQHSVTNTKYCTRLQITRQRHNL